MIIERLVVGQLEVNCFILGCEHTRDAVIIDPGDAAGDILGTVRDLGLNISMVINTHGHFDHIGGNRQVIESSGARLLVHENDLAMLTRAATVAGMYGMTAENSPSPEQFLADGMTIEFGDCSMKVLHTPGHTQGGCSLYMEKDKLVFTGDTLFADSIGRTDLPGGNHELLLESIRTKLFTLPSDVTVWPGHGPASTIGHEKRFNPYF